MNLPDQHMHTIFSPDASKEATIEAYIAIAEKRGVKHLTFTDHADLLTRVDLFKAIPDFNDFHNKLQTLQATTDVHLHLGIELGYQPHAVDTMKTLVNKHPFEFIIMSIHEADQKDLCGGEFFEGKTHYEAVNRYFEIVLEAVQSDAPYDVFGHLDYIIRYGIPPLKDYNFLKHQSLIDAILTTIIKNGKGIELNTSGLRYNLAHMHPKTALLKRYKALGGSIITLGSDAHHPKDYQADFSLAVDILLSCGFEHIALYQNRTPSLVSIQKNTHQKSRL